MAGGKVYHRYYQTVSVTGPDICDLCLSNDYPWHVSGFPRGLYSNEDPFGGTSNPAEVGTKDGTTGLEG